MLLRHFTSGPGKLIVSPSSILCLGGIKHFAHLCRKCHTKSLATQTHCLTPPSSYTVFPSYMRASTVLYGHQALSSATAHAGTPLSPLPPLTMLIQKAPHCPVTLAMHPSMEPSYKTHSQIL